MALSLTLVDDSSSVTDTQRYHAFDSLRATMMLFGLVLHSAMGYVVFPTLRIWAFKDAHPSPFFDFLVVFIHSFRMPVFFVIAGFFAALLYTTRGAQALFHNRLRRIALPLACAWVVLFPLVMFAAQFAYMRSSVQVAIDPNNFTLARILNHLMHLWFLYDLLILYGVSLLVLPLVQRIPQSLRDHILTGFSGIVPLFYGPALFSLVTGLTLLPMQDWTFDTSDSFLPPLRILIAYGVFFLFGWLLYQRRALLSAFTLHAWGNMTVGLAFLGLYLFFAQQAFTTRPTPRIHLLTVASLAAATWFFVYSWLGLFLRYLERPIPLARYIADASYWMYLVHLPCTMVLPALLSTFFLPTFVKFSLVLGTTTLLTVVTYHYWVRATIIGKVLNGRRYPRALPQLTLQPAVQQEPASVSGSM